MKHIFLCVLMLTVIKGYCQGGDTSEVYFDVNVASLGNTASMRLDSLKFAKVIVPGSKIIVFGYGDYLGDEAYNKALSASRAKNVKQYLVSLGVDSRDIIICEGKGKLIHNPVPGEHGLNRDRKVAIITHYADNVGKTTSSATAGKNPDGSNGKHKTSGPKAVPDNSDGTNPDGAVAGTKTTKPKTSGPKTGGNKPDSTGTATKTHKPKSSGPAVTGSTTDSTGTAAKTHKPKSSGPKAGMNTTDSTGITSKTSKPRSSGPKAGMNSSDSTNAADKTSRPKNPGPKTGGNKTDSTGTATKPSKPKPSSGPKTGENKTDSTGNAGKSPKPKNPAPKTGGNRTDSAGIAGKTSNPAASGPKTTTSTPDGTGTNHNSTGPNPTSGTGTTGLNAGTPTSDSDPTKTKVPEVAKSDTSTPLVVHTLTKHPPVVVRKPEKDIPTLDPAKLAIGEIVPLNNIYFAPASNEMLRQSQPSLDQLFKFLNENKNLYVEIQGRICCLSPLDGTDEPDGHGSTRSTARAKNIYDFLVSKGIEKNRVTYSGLGNTKPTVYPEKTEYDRDLNRRAVMKIVKK